MKDTQATIPVVEEQVHVAKREVPAGKVRVHTTVEAVEEIVGTTLEEERVEVERVPVGREVQQAPAIRTEGDATIIPVVEEVLVVEKRLYLKEEVHIRRHVSRQRVEAPVTVRKQRAIVERVPPDEEAHSDEESER